MDEVASLAARLRSLKDRSGMSFDSLAKRTGVSKSSLHRYCAGTKMPSGFAPLHAMAKACGASSGELQEIRELWATADSPHSSVDPQSGMAAGEDASSAQHTHVSRFPFPFRAAAGGKRFWKFTGVAVLALSVSGVAYVVFRSAEADPRPPIDGINYARNLQPVSVHVFNVERGCQQRDDHIPACSLGLARDPRRKYDADNVVAHRVWHNDTLIADCVFYEGDRVADETGVGTTRWFRVKLNDVPSGYAWLPAVRSHDSPGLPRCGVDQVR
ncbi:helix-turn-helix transcriptional regulator [Streptomyces sp. NPDC046985]|uniref:helix-turn-helix domain-containing protein n=1 Tax=Streptomyces sp. NPDC046985 TaxID=3155377 RepID=UPI0033EC05B5